MWTSFKTACTRSNELLAEGRVASHSEIKSLIDSLKSNNIIYRLHRPLDDQPRSTNDYQALAKADVERVRLCAEVEPQIFSRTFIEEAQAFVQLYSMNELDALRLVYSAYCIQYHYPGMARGLVAVLLYYDSKLQLLWLLLNLIELKSRTNIQDDDLERLVENGAVEICTNILNRCYKDDQYSYSKIFSLLCEYHGIGDATHVRELKKSLVLIQKFSGQLLCVIGGRSPSRVGPLIFTELVKLELPLNDFTFRLLLSGIYILNGGITAIADIERSQFEGVDVAVIDLIYRDYLSQQFITPSLNGLLNLVYSLDLRYLPSESISELSSEDNCVVNAMNKGAFELLCKMCESVGSNDSSNIPDTLHFILITYLTLMPFNFEVLVAKNSQAFVQITDCMQHLYKRFPLLANDYWSGIRVMSNGIDDEQGVVFSAVKIIEHLANHVNEGNLCVIANTLKCLCASAPEKASEVLAGVDCRYNLLSFDKLVHALFLYRDLAQSTAASNSSMFLTQTENRALCCVISLYSELFRLHAQSAEFAALQSDRYDLCDILKTLITSPPSFISYDLRIAMIDFLGSLVVHRSIADSFAPQIQELIGECSQSVPLAFSSAMLHNVEGRLLESLLNLTMNSIDSLELPFAMEFAKSICGSVLICDKLRRFSFEDDQLSWSVYELAIRIIDKLVEKSGDCCSAAQRFSQDIIEACAGKIATVLSTAFDLLESNDERIVKSAKLIEFIHTSFHLLISLAKAQRKLNGKTWMKLTFVEELVVIRPCLLTRMITFLATFNDNPNECSQIVEFIEFILDNKSREAILMHTIHNYGQNVSQLRNCLINICENQCADSSREGISRLRLLETILQSLKSADSIAPEISFSVFMLDVVREGEQMVIREPGDSLDSRSVYHVIRDSLVINVLENGSGLETSALFGLEILYEMTNSNELTEFAMNECWRMFGRFVRFVESNTQPEHSAIVLRILAKVLTYRPSAYSFSENSFKSRDIVAAGLCVDPLERVIKIASIDFKSVFDQDLSRLSMVRQEAIPGLLRTVTCDSGFRFSDRRFADRTYCLDELNTNELEKILFERFKSVPSEIAAEDLKTDEELVLEACIKYSANQKLCYSHVKLLAGWCYLIEAVGEAYGKWDQREQFTILTTLLTMIRNGMPEFKCGEYDVGCMVLSGLESMAVSLHKSVIASVSGISDYSSAVNQLFAEQSLESIREVLHLGPSYSDSPQYRIRRYSLLLVLLDLYFNTVLRWHRHSRKHSITETENALMEIINMFPESDLFVQGEPDAHIACLRLHSRLISLAPQSVSFFIETGKLANLIQIMSEEFDKDRALSDQLHLFHTIIVIVGKDPLTKIPEIFEFFKYRMLARVERSQSVPTLKQIYFRTVASLWMLIAQPRYSPMVKFFTSDLVNWLNEHEEAIVNEIRQPKSNKASSFLLTMVHTMTTIKENRLHARLSSFVEEIFRQRIRSTADINERDICGLLGCAYYLQSNNATLSSSIIGQLNSLVKRIRIGPVSELDAKENIPCKNTLIDIGAAKVRRLVLEFFFGLLFKWQNSLPTLKRSVGQQMKDAGLSAKSLRESIETYYKAVDIVQKFGANVHWDTKTIPAIAESLIECIQFVEIDGVFDSTF